VRRRALVFQGVVVPISLYQRALEYKALRPLLEMFGDSAAMVEVRLTTHYPTAALHHNPFVHPPVTLSHVHAITASYTAIKFGEVHDIAGRRRSGGFLVG
jgi:hypothetical protein